MIINPQNNAQAKSPGSWKGKIALFTASLLMTLVVTELFLALFTDLRRDEIKLYLLTKDGGMNCYSTNPRKYFPLTATEERSGRKVYCVAYNMAKRREGFFPARKEQTALVGDSFTFGEGVKDEDTLAYLLDARFPSINFRNFGAPGADIPDVRQAVSGILTNEKQIRNIIYFYNLNDIIRCKELEDKQRSIIDFENVRWGMIRNNSLTSILSQSALFRLSQKAFVLRRQTRLTIKNYQDMYFGGVNSKELEASLQMLAEMNTLAEENGVRFFVVIYPLLYKDGRGAYPFTGIHRLLAGFCGDHGIRCVDGAHAFDGFPDMRKFIVHAVDYHPNESANRRMIDYLMRTHEFDLLK